MRLKRKARLREYIKNITPIKSEEKEWDKIAIFPNGDWRNYICDYCIPDGYVVLTYDMLMDIYMYIKNGLTFDAAITKEMKNLEHDAEQYHIKHLQDLHLL